MSYIHSAKFISGPEDWGKHCPKFKRSFDIQKTVKSAALEISSLGVYECFINGERVGDYYMAPGWTFYPKRVQYQRYDVTHMLADKNEIVIGAGHGWFASRIGAPTTVKGVYGQYPAIICALHIEYADGEAEDVVTDSDWLVGKSEIYESQIYDGERYDATVKVDYAQNANIYDYQTNIIPHEGAYVKEIQRIPAENIIITPKGEIVVDFGQEITGTVEFHIENAKKGQRLLIECAEILDKDGNFYNENYRSAKSLIEYITDDGAQSYKPHYTFYGFRYIRLGGWCEDVKTENFTAIVMHSEMARTGYFECGHKKLNKLYSNIIWGQVDNFLDIPTDCPQRDERLGWTGDAQVFCRTASINYDTEIFFRKWLRDLALEQRENGEVPQVIPWVFGRKCKPSAAWGDAATVCPYEVYQAYGNREMLEEFYPMMKKWVEFMHGSGDEEYLWLGGDHYGDWLGIDAPAGSYKGSTNEDLIATAFYYHSTEILVKAARILDKPTDEIAYYEDVKGKIKAAFNEKFVDGDRLVGDTQTAYVLAIHFGLCDAEMREKFGKRLVELIENAGDSLTTGFVGTPYLMDALTEIGRSDKAYKLLLREQFPGWLYSVNMGATTVWEHWDGINAKGEVWSKDMNSFNHYAYGAVASWMYRTCAGIRQDENHPAYKHFFIEPIPSEALGFVKASIQTRSGKIVSEWRIEGNKVHYHFEIPDGTSATVKIGNENREYVPGSYDLVYPI